MHNATFSHRNSYPLFDSVTAVMALIALPPLLPFFLRHNGFTVQNNKKIYQESPRNDVATGNAGWPSQTQTQAQRCGRLRCLVCSHVFLLMPGFGKLEKALGGPMRDIPPHIAQYPFEIVSQRGVSHLVFTGYRASIAEIPLLRGGYRTSTLHALQGGNAQKRRRGYRTQLAMLRKHKPHSRIARNRGVLLR